MAKTKYQAIQCILRVSQLYQNCIYAKISQLLEAGQFCRYVGDIASFMLAIQAVLLFEALHKSFQLRLYFYEA